MVQKLAVPHFTETHRVAKHCGKRKHGPEQSIQQPERASSLREGVPFHWSQLSDVICFSATICGLELNRVTSDYQLNTLTSNLSSVKKSPEGIFPNTDGVPYRIQKSTTTSIKVHTYYNLQHL